LETLRTDSGQDNTYGNMREIVARIGKRATASLLRNARLDPQTSVLDMIIASFSSTLGRELGSSRFQVDLEGHGREPLPTERDFTRTVGWFASVYPLEVSLERKTNLRALATDIHDRRTKVPRGGLAFGAVRARGLQGGLAAVAQRSAVVINYVPHLYDGFVELPFSVLPGEQSIDRSPLNSRFYEIELLATLEDGELILRLAYCPHLHSDELTRRILAGATAALREGSSWLSR
jgi:hypothetical protein